MQISKSLKSLMISVVLTMLFAAVAHATIDGCTVTSYTEVKDPTNSAYMTLISSCSTITLKDTLYINFEGGFAPIGDKIIEFSREENTAGKDPLIKTNVLNLSLGTLKIKPTPMSSGTLGGDWPDVEKMETRPKNLIEITGKLLLPDTSIMENIGKYGGGDSDAEDWSEFWDNGYSISYKADSTNPSKVEFVTLNYTPVVDPVSPDSGDASVDDGGGGCNMGWSVFLLGIAGIAVTIYEKKRKEK